MMQYRRTQERIMRFVLQSNERHSKFSARILAASGDPDACNGVVEVKSYFKY